MKELLKKLDKVLENRIRLGIMSALMVNDELDFSTLKDLLGVTDGNLASHLKSLEKNQYIEFSKSFINRKPNTNYAATTKGKSAFINHIQAIEQILKQNE